MDLPFQHRFYKLRTRGNISPVEREGEGGGARFLRPSGEEEKIGPRQFPFRKGEAGKRVRGGHTRGKGEGERRREWKIRKWNEPLLLPFLFHSPPPSTPLPHLDGYFPLLKEKRERERGERRMCRMQFHRDDDVCEDACCFPRGCVLSLLLPFHKETIFVAGARG